MTAGIGQRPATRIGPADELTADAPPEAKGLSRDAVRLLVASEQDGAVTVEHTMFRALAVLRVVVLLNTVGLYAYRVHAYDHPVRCAA